MYFRKVFLCLDCLNANVNIFYNFIHFCFLKEKPYYFANFYYSPFGALEVPSVGILAGSEQVSSFVLVLG